MLPLLRVGDFMATRKNASGSGSSMLTLGLLAVGGYFVYEWFFATPAAATPTTTTPTTPTTPTSPTTTTTVTTPTTPPAGSGTPSSPATTPSGQTLDAIYKKIIATASADPNFTGSGASLTGLPDHFNVYLGLAAPGLTVPISVFSDPNTPITVAAYWALMAPALQGANAGLSGLGCYGGVGAYMRGLGAYQW